MAIRKIRTLVTLFAIGFALIGCSHLPSDNKLNFWRGKISIQQPSQSAVATRFELFQRTQNQYRWFILTPIGTRLAQIDVDKNSVCATIGSESTRCYDDVQTLLQQQLGLQAPLNSLPSWMQGRCVDSLPCQIQQTESNQIYMQQGPWLIQIVRFDERNQPKLLRIVHRENEQTNLQLTLAIQESHYELH